MLYRRIPDGSDNEIYVLDSSYAMNIDREHPACFVPALIIADPETHRIKAASHLMMQDQKTVDNAIAELDRYGFPLGKGIRFSRKVTAMACMLKAFGPVLAKQGNRPEIEVIGKDGRKRRLDIFSLMDNSRLADSVDWKRTERLYRGKDITIYLADAMKAKRRARREKVESLYEMSLPSAFAISVIGLDRQRDELGGFIRKSSPKEYDRFLLNIRTIDLPARKRSRETPMHGPRFRPGRGGRTMP